MSGTLNANTSAEGDDNLPFASTQSPPPFPYIGFEHAAAAGTGRGGQQLRHYEKLETAHHRMVTLRSSIAPMALPPLPMPIPCDVYPAHGVVKREGDGAAGRIRLNLGQQRYCSPGDMLPVDRLLMQTCLGGVFTHHQPPRCQVEGCIADLSGAKHYHRRHKVCEYHTKDSAVATCGKQQRFCQQCSRFHVLTEFDEAKRSCRKQLAEHNRRRRKKVTTVTAKNSITPSKKPNSGATTDANTSGNKYLRTTKSTISTNTGVRSCLDRGKQARPTLTLGAAQDKDQQLNTMLLVQAPGHHHELRFITSLHVQNSINNGSSNSSNIFSCSSLCSSTLPSAMGEASDKNTTTNMHLFEVDFM